jgi:hypothetical protein
MHCRDNDPPKPKPLGILGQLDPAQFSDAQQADLKANSDAVARWMDDRIALAMWVPRGLTQ